MAGGTILCSRDGCDIVIGKDGFGAKRARPCCKCAAAIIRENNAARERARQALLRAKARKEGGGTNKDRAAWLQAATAAFGGRP